MTRLVATVAAALTLAAPIPHAYASSERFDAPKKVTVRRGDVLSELFADTVGGWTRAAYINRLDDPSLIRPGDVLVVPERDGRRWVPPRPEQKASRSWQPFSSASSSPESPSGSSSASSSSATDGHNWDAVAACESGGDWQANTGNGYYGGLQFSLASWRAVGGFGYPHQASKATQIAMAERLLAAQGAGAWPHCGAYL